MFWSICPQGLGFKSKLLKCWTQLFNSKRDPSTNCADCSWSTELCRHRSVKLFPAAATTQYCQGKLRIKVVWEQIPAGFHSTPWLIYNLGRLLRNLGELGSVAKVRTQPVRRHSCNAIGFQYVKQNPMVNQHSRMPWRGRETRQCWIFNIQATTILTHNGVYSQYAHNESKLVFWLMYVFLQINSILFKNSFSNIFLKIDGIETGW